MCLNSACVCGCGPCLVVLVRSSCPLLAFDVHLMNIKASYESWRSGRLLRPAHRLLKVYVHSYKSTPYLNCHATTTRLRSPQWELPPMEQENDLDDPGILPLAPRLKMAFLQRHLR